MRTARPEFTRPAVSTLLTTSWMVFSETIMPRIFFPIGIYAGNDAFIPVLAAGVQVSGNRVRNLIQIGGGRAAGISVNGTNNSVRDNLIVQQAQTLGWGIICGDGDGRVRDNVIKSYET